jgi:hypothetical protein
VRLHDERQLPSTKQLGTLPPKSSCQRRQWLFETRTELAATMVAWDSQVSSGNYCFHAKNYRDCSAGLTNTRH